MRKVYRRSRALLSWGSWARCRLAFFAAALCLSVSCVNAHAHARSSAGGHVCPPGTHDYGDGMVASVLPEQTLHALKETHLIAQREAGESLSNFLSEQSWRPHVSIIYGVTDEKATPAAQALHAFTASHSGTMACFGGLIYFDDARGHKTSLVIDVQEPANLFGALHEALAEAAHIGSRFAYHPLARPRRRLFGPPCKICVGTAMPSI